MRGWATNEVAAMNREKVELALEYNFLDSEAELRVLSDDEHKRLDHISKGTR